MKEIVQYLKQHLYFPHPSCLSRKQEEKTLQPPRRSCSTILSWELWKRIVKKKDFPKNRAKGYGEKCLRSYSQGVKSRPNQRILPSLRQHLPKGILEFVETVTSVCFPWEGIWSMWGADSFFFCSCSFGSKRATSRPDIETISHYPESSAFTLEVKTKLLFGTSGCLSQRRSKFVQQVGKGGYWITEYQRGGLWEFVLQSPDVFVSIHPYVPLPMGRL